MAEYVLETVSVEPAQFKVHNQNCSSLESLEATRYLGSFGNSQAAVTKAVNLHHGVDSCADCLAG